jgi:hypothetical protein
MALPAWLPISLSAAGVIISLSAFAYQVHRARFNQSVDLLFRLENDFFGAAKRNQRANAARELAEGRPLEAEPILDFFETMALLLRRKALDAEMVWHTFYYWIDNYYEVLRPYIEERQSREPLVWQDLPGLVLTVRRIQASRLGRSPSARTEDEMAAFLHEEQTEAAA